MNNTLVIPQVNLDKLDRQRLILANFHPENELTQTQSEALDGVLGMLDSWSDGRYHGVALQMGDLVAWRQHKGNSWADYEYIYLCTLPDGTHCLVHEDDWDPVNTCMDIIHAQHCVKAPEVTNADLSHDQVNCLKDNGLWEE